MAMFFFSFAKECWVKDKKNNSVQQIHYCEAFPAEQGIREGSSNACLLKGQSTQYHPYQCQMFCLSHQEVNDKAVCRKRHPFFSELT
ncbi:hypothetical protein CEXT_414741 [Caerostris extrusa]|uniref:Secreted protein n=1 Tax=Caerostris extrusa TaxID=172846 RepID=A0AAV4MD06_CAEEX|nr:hypothetical protein CEXT_414741 [Caerostris extrusa]